MNVDRNREDPWGADFKASLKIRFPEARLPEGSLVTENPSILKPRFLLGKIKDVFDQTRREFYLLETPFHKTLMVLTGVGSTVFIAGVVGLPFVNYSEEVRTIVGFAVAGGIGIIASCEAIAAVSKSRLR